VKSVKLVVIYALTAVIIAFAGEGLWLLTMQEKQQAQWFVLGLGILFLASGIWISTVWHMVHKTVLPKENHMVETNLGDFAQLHGLSKAEIEVLDLLVQGFGNAEIAAARHVSLNTVKTHLAKVYSKTGVANRGKLIALIKSEKT
jgi:DNA-binding CsgD family transcriptional regulator